MRLPALIFATQHAMPSEFGEKWETKVPQWKRCILTQSSQVHSAYRTLKDSEAKRQIHTQEDKILSNDFFTRPKS